MSIKTQAVSGVKWTTISTVITATASIVKIAILARFLDADDFGLMAIITLVLGFMNLFMDMGLTTAILHKQQITKNEYASLYWINIGISVVLFGLIYLGSPLISLFYEEPELSILIPLASVSILMAAVGQQFKTISEKQLNFKYVALADGSSALIGLVVGVLYAVWGYGVYALVYSALVQYAIANSIYLYKGIREKRLHLHFNYQESKPFLRIGIYQVGSQIINYFNRDLDLILIGKFFGSEILGGYSLAKELVKKPMMILNPIITKVAGPVLSLFQNDQKQLQQKYMRFLNLISTANFLVYSGIALLAYPIVYVLYGKEFLTIAGLVQILSLCMFIRSIGNPINGLVVATGRTDISFKWNLLVLCLMPVVIYIGALFSIETVAWTLSIVTFGLLFLGWRMLILPMCGASLKTYLQAIIPSYRQIFNLFSKELLRPSK